MIKTRTGEIYTGITTDVDRRLMEHEEGKGAKSLRGRGPLTLVYRKPVDSQSEALKLEVRIKKLSRARKLDVVAGELDPATLTDGK